VAEIVVCKKMLFELRIKQSTRKEYKAGPAPLEHLRGIKAGLLEWLCTGTRTTDEGETRNSQLCAALELSGSFRFLV